MTPSFLVLQHLVIEVGYEPTLGGLVTGGLRHSREFLQFGLMKIFGSIKNILTKYVRGVKVYRKSITRSTKYY